jgi:rhamnosyltransferase
MTYIPEFLARSCCAVVVTYHPPASAAATINAITPQCGHVIVIDNGSNASELENIREIAESDTNVELICNAENIGLASALNQGWRLAAERGFQTVLFLDQDTVPLHNMVADLLAAWRSQPQPDRIGVVGSNHYDDQGNLGHPTIVGQSAVAVPFVITSGSLSPIAIFDKVGPFRDDFFIDCVDTEFGYRLELRGFKSILCLEPTMRHMWGDPFRYKLLFCIETYVSNHSPFRRYFIMRNNIYLLTRYFVQFPARSALGLFRVSLDTILLLLKENRKWEKARAMFVGFFHGLCGRLGRIPEHLT